MMYEDETLIEIGRVIHYYNKIDVVVVSLSDGLKKGDTIRVKGFNTDFLQPVESMQVDHKSVDEAESGDSIGLHVVDRVRSNDIIYRIE